MIIILLVIAAISFYLGYKYAFVRAESLMKDSHERVNRVENKMKSIDLERKALQEIKIKTEHRSMMLAQEIEDYYKLKKNYELILKKCTCGGMKIDGLR